MTDTFKKRQSSFLLQLIFASLIIYAIHSYLLYYFTTDIYFFFPIWHIYLFHFIVTALIFTVINYKYVKENTNIFNIFMLGTLVKMIITIVFLLPLLLSDFEDKKPDVINFFIPYFLFLSFEVFSLTALLKKN